MKSGSFSHTSFKGVHEFLRVHFRLAHQTHQNRTPEMHMRPLSHFIIERPTVLRNFNNIIFYKFSERNIKAPWRRWRSTKTCRSIWCSADRASW